jgi:hypothetical protein
MQISDAHMNEADRIFEGAGMVQGHEALGSFHFARGDTLL